MVLHSKVLREASKDNGHCNRMTLQLFQNIEARETLLGDLKEVEK